MTTVDITDDDLTDQELDAAADEIHEAAQQHATEHLATTTVELAHQGPVDPPVTGIPITVVINRHQAADILRAMAGADRGYTAQEAYELLLRWAQHKVNREFEDPARTWDDLVNQIADAGPHAWPEQTP